MQPEEQDRTGQVRRARPGCAGEEGRAARPSPSDVPAFLAVVAEPQRLRDPGPPHPRAALCRRRGRGARPSPESHLPPSRRPAPLGPAPRSPRGQMGVLSARSRGGARGAGRARCPAGSPARRAVCPARRRTWHRADRSDRAMTALHEPAHRLPPRSLLFRAGGLDGPRRRRGHAQRGQQEGPRGEREGKDVAARAVVEPARTQRPYPSGQRQSAHPAAR